MPSHLAAACCCGPPPPVSGCYPEDNNLTVSWDGYSLRSTQNWDRIFSEFCGTGQDNLFNCAHSIQVDRSLDVASGSLEVMRGDRIREAGWYSDNYLMNVSPLLHDNRWPSCQHCCYEPSRDRWYGRPFNGVEQVQNGMEPSLYSYHNGMGGMFGGFGSVSQRSSMGPGTRSGIPALGSPCWTTETTGDVVSFPNEVTSPSPCKLSFAYAKVRCLDLGDGKVAFSGFISFKGFGIHNKRAGDVMRFGRCDFNECECNYSEPGCRRSGPEPNCYERGRGGIYRPCDPAQPWDWRCRCFCHPYVFEGPCYEGPDAHLCTPGCSKNCYCNRDCPGQYDGCAPGPNNGWDLQGGPDCDSIIDCFGKPYLNHDCPGGFPGDHFCGGPPYFDCVDPNGPHQIPSCHGECGNDFREMEGSVWTMCSRPGIGLGVPVYTTTIFINPPDIPRSDIPWCHECSAKEYFKTFNSDEYHAIGSNGVRVNVGIE